MSLAVTMSPSLPVTGSVAAFKVASCISRMASFTSFTLTWLATTRDKVAPSAQGDQQLCDNAEEARA